MAGLREKLFGESQSLREKLGAVSDKVQGATMIASGILTRSTGLMSSGAEKVSGFESKEEKDYSKLESQSQIDANYRMGYKSDKNGNITERLPREVRENLAKQYPKAAVELLYDNKEEEPTDNEVPTEKPVVNFTKSDLVFQEATSGDGVPYVQTDSETKSIAEIAPSLPESPEQPIQSLTITDATGTESVITDPERLATANQIAAVADAVAPEYKNYLLKLAFREGGLKADAFRGEEDNPGGGDDRGVFQINSKAFPTITKEMADDVRLATLWAISLIESANPVTGDQRREGQEKWYSNEWAKAADVQIQ